MNVEETRAYAQTANAEIDLGLRAMSPALESQRAFAESAQEVDRITGQIGVTLGQAMGFLATAMAVAEHIETTSKQIDGLLEQLPTSEVVEISSPNQMAGGIAGKIFEQVAAIYTRTSLQEETTAALRGIFVELKHPPDVNSTWVKLHHVFSRIYELIGKL